MKRFVLAALVIAALLVAAPLEGFAESHNGESEWDKNPEKVSTATVVEDDREHYRNDKVEESLDVSGSYVVFQWSTGVMLDDEEERIDRREDRS